MLKSIRYVQEVNMIFKIISITVKLYPLSKLIYLTVPIALNMVHNDNMDLQPRK